MTRPLHRCAIPNCQVPIPSRFLMCMTHWRQVPRALQRMVLHEHRRGFGRAYFEAMKAAVSAVQAHGAAHA